MLLKFEPELKRNYSNKLFPQEANFLAKDPFMPIPLSVQTYSNLDKLENINIIRNYYNKKGIIYGIVNNLNNKIYVGSTTDTNNRFYTHFIKPKRSNKHLQSAIKLTGLSNFTLHIFTVIELSDSFSLAGWLRHRRRG